VTVTFREIACTTRHIVSPDVEYIDKQSYNQSPELMGYRLFWRHLLQICQPLSRALPYGPCSPPVVREQVATQRARLGLKPLEGRST